MRPRFQTTGAIFERCPQKTRAHLDPPNSHQISLTSADLCPNAVEIWPNSANVNPRTSTDAGGTLARCRSNPDSDVDRCGARTHRPMSGQHRPGIGRFDPSSTAVGLPLWRDWARHPQRALLRCALSTKRLGLCASATTLGCHVLLYGAIIVPLLWHCATYAAAAVATATTTTTTSALVLVRIQALIPTPTTHAVR